MQDLRAYDVLICGSGIVGLAMALALVPTGLRIALLDPQPVPPLPQGGLDHPDFDARVSALTPASRLLFEELGVWNALAALRLCAYTDMRVWDADGTGSIHFAAAELHQPCLGYIVENGLISGVLANAARTSGRVELLQGSLENFVTQGDMQLVTLADGTQLHCRLLLGADGGNSRVRCNPVRSLRIQFAAARGRSFPSQPATVSK